jgi:hypothetical protein
VVHAWRGRRDWLASHDSRVSDFAPYVSLSFRSEPIPDDGHGYGHASWHVPRWLQWHASAAVKSLDQPVVLLLLLGFVSCPGLYVSLRQICV